MWVVDWVGSEKQHFLQTSDLSPKGANVRCVLWPLTGPVCVLAEGPWPYAGPTLRRLVSEFMFTAQNMTKLFQTKQTNKNNATIKIWTKHDVWFSLALQWKYYWKWRPIVFLIEIGSKRNCSGNNCHRLVGKPFVRLHNASTGPTQPNYYSLEPVSKEVILIASDRSFLGYDVLL